MSWIRTYTGKAFYPLAPRWEEVNILDIAHALSNQCRFSGHTIQFFSVAQHSVLVSVLLGEAGESPLTQLTGLLHDAPEAYLVDLPTPIKRLMPEYQKAEKRVWEAVRERFKLEEMGEAVKSADLRMLATEARDLMGNPLNWVVLSGLVPAVWRVIPVSPEEAKMEFLVRYRELCKDLGRTVEMDANPPLAVIGGADIEGAPV